MSIATAKSAIVPVVRDAIVLSTDINPLLDVSPKRPASSSYMCMRIAYSPIEPSTAAPPVPNELRLYDVASASAEKAPALMQSHCDRRCVVVDCGRRGK